MRKMIYLLCENKMSTYIYSSNTNEINAYKDNKKCFAVNNTLTINCNSTIKLCFISITEYIVFFLFISKLFLSLKFNIGAVKILFLVKRESLFSIMISATMKVTAVQVLSRRKVLKRKLETMHHTVTSKGTHYFLYAIKLKG